MFIFAARDENETLKVENNLVFSKLATNILGSLYKLIMFIFAARDENETLKVENNLVLIIFLKIIL